jgi:hypothetical protein
MRAHDKRRTKMVRTARTNLKTEMTIAQNDTGLCSQASDSQLEKRMKRIAQNDQMSHIRSSKRRASLPQPGKAWT